MGGRDGKTERACGERGMRGRMRDSGWAREGER